MKEEKEEEEEEGDSDLRVRLELCILTAMMMEVRSWSRELNSTRRARGGGAARSG